MEYIFKFKLADCLTDYDMKYTKREEFRRTRVRESADLIWNPCSTEKSFFLYQVTVSKNKGRKWGGQVKQTVKNGIRLLPSHSC